MIECQYTFVYFLFGNILIQVISAALIRNNKPGVSAFRLGNGYVGLKDALASDNLKFQR
jgi:hypothetical protein